MKSTPTLLILMVCALTGCVRVDVAGAISNFDRKSEALLVPIDTDDWEIYRVGDTQYVETKRVLLSPNHPISIQDPSFSQLPHRNFNIEEVLQEQYYFAPDTGQKREALPAYTVPEEKSEKMRHVYPWYTVGNEYRPINLSSPIPSPHRYWTVPASILAFVAIDIPGSIVLSALSLPCDICYGLTIQQQQQATIEATYAAPRQQSKKLSPKDIAANKQFADKVKAAAKTCDSIRLRKSHIRDTAKHSTISLSPSQQTELRQILSTVQAVQKEAELYATPAHHIYIDFLAKNGASILSLRDDFICSESATTQLARLVLSKADARRLRNILFPKNQLTPGEQNFTIRMGEGERLDLSELLQRLIPEMGEHDLNGVLVMKNHSAKMSVHTTSKGNGYISLPGIEIPFIDCHDNGSVFSPPRASLVLDDTDSAGTQLHVSYTELRSENDREDSPTTSNHICKTYLYHPLKACFTEK